MFELRYLVRPGWDGPEKVLQYTTQKQITDYSSTTTNGSYTTKVEWTEWEDVPTVDETK